MVISRAPMYIKFFEAGEVPGNYSLAAAIDKYVYAVINRTPLVNHISARYSKTENVDDPQKVNNTRIKESLLKAGIKNNLEFSSFASIPIRSGFGSNSSFTAALINGLYSAQELAVNSKKLFNDIYFIENKVSQDRIDICDIHAPVFGGLNMYKAEKNGKVTIVPVWLDYKNRMKLEQYLQVYYIENMSRKVKERITTYNNLNTNNKKVVKGFCESLLKGNIKECANFLEEGWFIEIENNINVAYKLVDSLYEKAKVKGIYGGKYIGDSESGCLILLGDKKAHDKVNKMMLSESGLKSFIYRISFVQTGVSTIYELKT